MNLKEELLTFMQGNDYHPMKVSKLAKHFSIKDSEDFTNFMKCLNELEDERYIARNSKDAYDLSSRLGYFEGKFRLNSRGFGFVDIDDKSYFISEKDAHSAMDQDLVYIKTWYSIEGYCGEVVSIIERNTKTIVGVIKNKNGDPHFLSDQRLNQNIRIMNMDAYDLKNDTKVLLQIDKYGKTLKCRIIKVLGFKYETGIDVLSALMTKGIMPEFPQEVEQMANALTLDINKEQLAKRRDLRNLLTITIDGDDAKDLDDAISVEKIENGYRLYVHIADVSYYVTKDSLIDKEAYRRGTSIYVVDRVVPMLPTALSNGLCSLHPHVDRFTITCKMDFDKKGNLIGSEIFESIINSDERMTYHNVNEILEGNQEVMKKYSYLLKMLMYAKMLSDALLIKRDARGAINFDTKEAKIILDDKGIPVEIKLRERKEAEMLIEQFMIAANECVASTMKWMEIPSIYRIHESPEVKKMVRFVNIARTLGYTFNGGIQNVYSAQLQNMLNEAKGNENYDVLSRFMLRSMQKARYDKNCIGHFGLGLKEYLHFTSPIRRYPDLVVHRMLRKYLFDHCNDEKQMEMDELWCEDAAFHASSAERVAIDAERDIDDMKKAQYMEPRVGETYIGVISGVTKFGFFVELDNTVEGLVHISTLRENYDDYYVYNDRDMSLMGEYSGRSFHMGDKINVIVIGANRYERTVDFALVEKKKRKSKNKKRG